MRITVNLPDEELEEAIRHTGAQSREEAIVEAIREFNRYRRLESLADQLGTFEGVATSEEVLRLREMG